MKYQKTSSSSKPRVAFFSSCVDLGTTSITKVLGASFHPVACFSLSKGFKKLSLKDLIGVLRFLIFEVRQCDVFISAFNAPVLISGLFGWISGRPKKVAILEWNELTDRSKQKIPFFRYYGQIYTKAFAGFHECYSPSPRFIEFYAQKGIAFKMLYLPLPAVDSAIGDSEDSKSIRVLFIGGDINRKGGKELLSAWEQSPPEGATLSFVSHQAPDAQIAGVTFYRNISSGTVMHTRLFHEHDVLVLPTHADSFGYVVLEALANGLCVVTTEQAGSAHVVKLFGGLVKENANLAVRSMLELVTCPKDVASLKKKAREYRKTYQELVDASCSSVLAWTT